MLFQRERNYGIRQMKITGMYLELREKCEARI